MPGGQCEFLIVDQMALLSRFDPAMFPLVLSGPCSSAKTELEGYFYPTSSTIGHSLFL